MKYIVTIVFALLLSGKGFAQGNLQFNQVLTYQGEISSTTAQSTTYTVPDGKIWKIEYLSEMKKITNPDLIFFGPVINGKSQNIEIGSNPIWLKSGDTIYYRNHNYNIYGPNEFGVMMQSFLISIIEYNIIP